MKAITIMVIAVFYTVLAYGQNEASITTRTNQSVVRKSPAVAEYRDFTSEACYKYSGMKTTGIVLTSIGGVALATGIGILAASNSGAIHNGNDGGYYRGTTPLRAGGAAAVTIGGISLGAGIPLIVVGSVKSKRICVYDPGHGDAYLELHTGENGTGLAMKF